MRNTYGYTGKQGDVPFLGHQSKNVSFFSKKIFSYKRQTTCCFSSKFHVRKILACLTTLPPGKGLLGLQLLLRYVQPDQECQHLVACRAEGNVLPWQTAVRLWQGDSWTRGKLLGTWSLPQLHPTSTPWRGELTTSCVLSCILQLSPVQRNCSCNSGDVHRFYCKRSGRARCFVTALPWPRLF